MNIKWFMHGSCLIEELSHNLVLTCWIEAHSMHACLYCRCLSCFHGKMLHACSQLCLRPWTHHVLKRIGSFGLVLEALNWFEFMHVCMFSMFMILVWNWVWIKHPWALISQIELWIMFNYVFINVFQKMGPRGSVLIHLSLSLSLEVQSGISKFCTPARAGIVTLERGIQASSISLHCFTVRSSVGWALERRHVSHDRAGIKRPSSGDFTHPVLLQYARAGKLTLERVPLLHDRSSG